MSKDGSVRIRLLYLKVRDAREQHVGPSALLTQTGKLRPRVSQFS